MRPMRKLDAPRDSSFRSSLMSARDDCRAGIAPETSVVRTATAIVNSSTCGCSRMSMKNGTCVTVSARLNIAMPKYASPTPSSAATSDNTSASARNCLTTCDRDAPSAVRIPTSLVRCAARSSSRLATLAQAMSSTKKTAPSIVYSSWRGSFPIYWSTKLRTVAVKPSLLSLYSAARRLEIVARSTFA